jgi:hypothetical protein
MKQYVIVSILLFCAQSFAQSCGDLINDLTAIEKLLGETSPKDCDDYTQEARTAANKSGNPIGCCDRANTPESCLSSTNAKNKYNEAMAKLIILEGIIDLTKTLKQDHDKLCALSKEKIVEAKENSQGFIQSFYKAKLLQNSLELKDNISFWDEYEGKSSAELAGHIVTKCKIDKFEKFCESYKNIPDEKTKKEVLDTLTGFKNADYHTVKNDRQDRYKNYSNYLNLSVTENDNNQILTLADFEKKHLVKIQELAKLIKKYETSPSTALQKQILTLSEELNPIYPTFNTASEINNSVTSFINNDIQNNLGSLQKVTSSMLRLDSAKDNINKAEQIIELELKNKNAEQLARDFVNKYAEDKCKGKDPIDCLQENENDNELNKFGAQSVLKEIERIQQLEQFTAQISHLKQCLESKVVLGKKEDCLISKIQEYKDDYNNVKEEVLKAKKNLDFIAQAEPITEYETKKAFTIYALKEKKCLTADSKIADFAGSCRSTDLKSYEVNLLNLGKDMQDIQVAFDKGLYTKYFADKDKEGESEFKKHRKEMIEKCQQDDSSHAYCRHLINEVKMENYASQVALVEYKNVKDYKPEKDLPTGAAIAAGLGEAVTFGLPQYMFMKQQEDQTVMYMNHLKMQQAYRQQQNAYWKNYQHNLSGMQTPSNVYQNWGYNFYNPTQNTNFNLQNQSNIFYGPAPFNFGQMTFPPPMLTN